MAAIDFRSSLTSLIARINLAVITLIISGASLAADPIAAEDAYLENNKSWASFEPPADDKFDWIQLSSKEWLKGEIITLYNFVLEFDSDELGLLKIDWDDVRQLRSAGHVGLQLENLDHEQDNIVDVGKLILFENQALVINQGSSKSYARSRFISIAGPGYNELELWKGDIAFGVNLQSGNSDLVGAKLSFSSIRRTTSSTLRLIYHGNYSRAEGVLITNNSRLISNYDLFRNARSFWRIYDAEILQDEFKNIDGQFSLATSFGYKPIRNAKTELEFTGGIGSQLTRYVSVEPGESIKNTSPFITTSLKYDTELNNWVEFLMFYTFQLVDEDKGQNTHLFVTTLSTDITGDLELEISFVWDRVTNPQPDADGITPKEDDFKLVFGISYEI